MEGEVLALVPLCVALGQSLDKVTVGVTPHTAPGTKLALDRCWWCGFRDGEDAGRGEMDSDEMRQEIWDPPALSAQLGQAGGLCGAVLCPREQIDHLSF